MRSSSGLVALGALALAGLFALRARAGSAGLAAELARGGRADARARGRRRNPARRRWPSSRRAARWRWRGSSGAAGALARPELDERLAEVLLRVGAGLENDQGDARDHGEAAGAARDDRSGPGQHRSAFEPGGEVSRTSCPTKQARGAFGEVQLENPSPRCCRRTAYRFQAQLSNGKRAVCCSICRSRRGRSRSTPSFRSRAITRSAPRPTTPVGKLVSRAFRSVGADRHQGHRRALHPAGRDVGIGAHVPAERGGLRRASCRLPRRARRIRHPSRVFIVSPTTSG